MQDNLRSYLGYCESLIPNNMDVVLLELGEKLDPSDQTTYFGVMNRAMSETFWPRGMSKNSMSDPFTVSNILFQNVKSALRDLHPELVPRFYKLLYSRNSHDVYVISEVAVDTKHETIKNILPTGEAALFNAKSEYPDLVFEKMADDWRALGKKTEVRIRKWQIANPVQPVRPPKVDLVESEVSLKRLRYEAGDKGDVFDSAAASEVEFNDASPDRGNRMRDDLIRHGVDMDVFVPNNDNASQEEKEKEKEKENEIIPVDNNLFKTLRRHRTPEDLKKIVDRLHPLTVSRVGVFFNTHLDISENGITNGTEMHKKYKAWYISNYVARDAQALGDNFAGTITFYAIIEHNLITAKLGKRKNTHNVAFFTGIVPNGLYNAIKID